MILLITTPIASLVTPEEHFDQWELDQYVKVWHKGQLGADYPLVHMDMVEQADALRGLLLRFGKVKPLWVCEVCWNAHLSAYGSSELRQAAPLVRTYVGLVASGKVDKVFWYQLVDEGIDQEKSSMMMGLARADLKPKYAYYAYAWMSRMLQNRAWLRNEAVGPDVVATTFGEKHSPQEVLVAWTTSDRSYLCVNNDHSLDLYDLFGVHRSLGASTRHQKVVIPLDLYPIYIVGPKGLRAGSVPSPGSMA